jgi:hypothetical protein
MAGEGLERLGYYNGQRLEERDYRLEQRYHIDARRMVNRGLFSPGVVSGFLVEKVAGETRKVRVRKGVALDPVGRETILLDDVLIDVPNQKPKEGPGYLLIARYSEEAVEGGDPWCSGPTGTPRPARVREEVVLCWSEQAPDQRRCQSGSEGLDCGVLLALITLKPSCEVDAVFTGVREYARPTHISQVTPFSFEGEKDIDAANPKRLRFNINGVPASVRLYLWGDRFSTLYYTELGRHNHTFDERTGPATTSLSQHNHSLSGHAHQLPDAPPHHHDLWVDRRQYPPEPDPWKSNRGEFLAFSIPQPIPLAPPMPFYYDREPGQANSWVGDQTIPFVDSSGNRLTSMAPSPDVSGPASPTAGSGSETHDHALPQTVFAGASDAVARSGSSTRAYEYLDDLRVGLRVQNITTDITKAILDHLGTSWTSLGTGNQYDLLNNEEGTGEIDLLAIAQEKQIDLSLPGTYELTFSVTSGGGKVAYNLFVA